MLGTASREGGRPNDCDALQLIAPGDELTDFLLEVLRQMGFPV